MNLTTRRLRIAFGISCLFATGNLWAYGPRSVTSTGQVVKWTLPVRVDLECDLDVRGKDVTALVDAGLSTWVDLGDSNVTFTEATLGVDVTADNVCCYLYDSAACPSGPSDDGRNPIIIDDDGTIVAKFFGVKNRFATLGFAAVVTFDATTGQATKGEAVFNAACLQGVELEDCSSLGLSFTDDDFVSFIVHEIGHFLGLNHTQVNLTEATDNDTSNDDKITTMYPFFTIGNGANFKTPERDDQVGLAVLYPAEGFTSSTFHVSGTVYDENGSTEFGCANLIVRNSDSNLSRTDAISFVSGQLCAGGNFDDSCDGNYTIQGLNPNQSYTIEVESIDSDFRNSSGIPPCDGSGQQPTFDAKTRSGTLNSSGGVTISGVDFTLTNTSGNVNSVSLPTLDFSGPSRFDGLDGLQAIEVKSASDSCQELSDVCSVDSAGGGGGSCSLIPKQ